MRVGCQAAANQARGWRQVGVAPGAEPRPAEPQLQVEWARRRGEVEPWAGPSQAGPRRDATEKALGRGGPEPVLRGVGGLGKAEGPFPASGGAGPVCRPKGKILRGRKESGGSAGGGGMNGDS